jgi:antitoxin component of MazEF toxin-antitoxin module
MNQVIKSGNSLAITIPKKFVNAVGIKKGDTVKVEKHTDKSILIVHFSGVQQLVLSKTIHKERKTPKVKKNL